jgi:hypothetical protein
MSNSYRDISSPAEGLFVMMSGDGVVGNAVCSMIFHIRSSIVAFRMVFSWRDAW